MSNLQASSPPQARSIFTLFFFSAFNIAAGIGIQLVNMAYFGAGPEKDAFDIAFFIPSMMIYLFGLDLWKGLSIALFSRLSINQTEESGRVFSSIMTILLIVGSVLCVLCVIAAPKIVALVASGFDEQRFEICVSLLRLMAPVVLLLSISGFLDSVLIAHHVYGWGSFSQVLLKVSQIIAVLGWSRNYGINTLAIGTLVGLGMALVLQIFILHRHKLHYYVFYLNLKSAKLREALRQTVPLFISVILAQLALICVQNVASRGPVGTVACMNYAIRLVAIVGQLLVIPICTSYAPRIARLVESNNIAAARNLTVRSATWITYGIWSVAPAVILTCEPILSFILLRGNLSAEDISLIAFFMKVLILGGWGHGIGLLGIYLALAKAKAWRAFLVNVSNAVATCVTVITLALLVGVKFALPFSNLAAGVAAGVAGILWLNVVLGQVISIMVKRTIRWIAVVLLCVASVVLFDLFVSDLVITSALIKSLIMACLTLMLAPLLGILFKAPEIRPMLLRLRDKMFGWLINP